MCTFGPFSCIRKGTRRAGADTPHPLPPEGGTPLKKVRCCAAAQKEPQRGADSPASPVRRSSRCCAEVIPLSQNRTLDSVPFPGYNEHKERRCPQTVSPFGFAEITASLCRGGGYFFFVTSKTTVTTPRITRQNWNSSAYVTISISPFLPKRGNPPSHAGANRLQPFVAAPCPYSTMAVLPSQGKWRLALPQAGVNIRLHKVKRPSVT